MPSFGRLSKLQHSNRSQPGLTVDPPSLDSAAASASAPTHRSSAAPHHHHQQTDSLSASPTDEAAHQHQHQHPPRTSSKNPAALTQQTSSAGEQQLAPFAGRGNPHPHPHPHFYQAGSNPSDLQDNIGGGSPLYDTSPTTLPTQEQFSQEQLSRQQDRDFAEAAALARSQSQRYSTILPAHAPPLQSQNQNQHQRLSTAHHRPQHGQFSASTTSLDDLSQSHQGQPQQPQRSPQQLQQPQQPQQAQPQAQQHEKRSTRKLFRGIFSGSSRTSVIQDQQSQPPPQPHQQLHQHQPYQQPQQPQSSYDNTSGLARRPSKRVSSSGTPLPALNTGLSQAPQPPSANPDWQAQGSYSQLSSPLHDVGEAVEYQKFPISDNQQQQHQQQQRAAVNTIRQVSQDSSSSPYDDSPQQPQQQFPSSTSQPQVQIQRDINYDSDIEQPQVQQAHPASFYQRASQIHFQKAQFVALQAPEQNRLDPAQFGRSSQQASAETISQISHESPVTDPDQRSSSQPDEPSPAFRYGNPSQEYLPTPEPQITQPYTMSPPSGGPAQIRRGESEKGLRPSEPQAAPPGYRHSNSSSQALDNMVGGAAAPGGLPNPAFGQADQGRNSPQPSNPDSSRDADSEKAFKELLVKYKNVKRLYFDGRAQIDALSGQVETLQNAVANQRMSASRTAWDDNEYTTRFNRLNGAINNLSFNIRKDWRAVPEWLNSYVSNEALKTGKQEMTAVGRAVISRWLMMEIFNKCFHPGLEPVLSAQLKEIELSIRGNSHTIHSQEESDALTTKVVNWRMATLDGLAKQLNAPSMNGTRSDFTTKATTALTSLLYTFLNDPKPAGVDGSAGMIVELAVAIAANIPLESRDVAITYPLPGDIVQPSIMEVEKTGLPSLDGQKAEGNGDDDKKNPPKDARIRFAGFLALEVKGRQVLMKAPVWI